MASLSPEEWKALIAGGSERGLIYTNSLPKPLCAVEKGESKLGIISNGVSVTGRCAQQVADGRRGLWLQSRVYVRAHHYYHSWMTIFLPIH